MFGIIRPCRNRLGPELGESWLAHLCGLCLALRDDHGHLARVATNYDGLVISALVEAQSERSRRSAGPCALRGMRSADVAVGTGARLAASVSLVLASAKVGDHVSDGDGVFARAPIRGIGRQVARRWAAQAEATGLDLGFDPAVLVDAVRRQSSVEAAAGVGTSVLAVTEPTETAAGEAVAQTAVLTGRPGNAVALREVGRLFGRLAHLLDAVEDLAEDRASGAWNPLVATGTTLVEARRLCDDAAWGIELALREVEFADDRLVHVLLVHEVRESIRRAFGDMHAHAHKHASPEAHVHTPPSAARGHEPGPGSGLWAWPKLVRPPHGRGLVPACLAVLYQCGTCQYCCRDPYPGPCSGKPQDAWCNCDCGPGCDCSGCDCCGCDC
ncbi:DUF5685 family protein [Actinosynnema sp. NPDC023658]|uniref:DUF5685 family protein n=1 Tax=Actinosynnema sp. NPDC023658 TaxID=3155465 RepID=UPI0033FCA6F0